MADGSDAPADVVKYYGVLEEGYDCAFGSRFIRGSVVRDYPKAKLVMNRGANLVVRDVVPPRLQRHHECVQGVPARGDRDGSAATVEPLQPDRRAATQGDRPRTHATRSSRSPGRIVRRARPSCRCRRWGAATSSSFSMSSSSDISRVETIVAEYSKLMATKRSRSAVLLRSRSSRNDNESR